MYIIYKNIVFKQSHDQEFLFTHILIYKNSEALHLTNYYKNCYKSILIFI